MFSHARNVLTCSALLAAGMYAAKHLESVRAPGLWTIHLAGYAVAALGAVLLLLNLIDGLRRLAKRERHVALRVAAILLYVALSVRLTQVILLFRSAL